MNARLWGRWSSGVMAALMVSAPVFAATVRLERVVLLPSMDRSSVVLELSDAPQSVSTRRISDSVVELDVVTPIDAGRSTAASGTQSADSVAPRILKAPRNVRFVDSVTVRVLHTESGPVVRARIALSSMAQTVVRSSGRRVYVDVSAIPAGATPPPTSPATTAVAAAKAAPIPPRVAPEQAFRDAVRPSMDKLKELTPFLTSAASGGDPKVTGALIPTLVSLRASLAAQQPPDSTRASHAMVLSAIDRITNALAPDFTGDRLATVKQSVTTIDVVGAVLTE